TRLVGVALVVYLPPLVLRAILSPPVSVSWHSGRLIPLRRSPLDCDEPVEDGNASPSLIRPWNRHSTRWLTRGDPECPLRWTCKSTAKLADELKQQNHPVSPRTVAALLRKADYSLQANRKTREGKQHTDRNAQFEFISAEVKRLQRRRQPVISVDTKKKELVGNFKNAGQEWQPEG